VSTAASQATIPVIFSVAFTTDGIGVPPFVAPFRAFQTIAANGRRVIAAKFKLDAILLGL
jgi:hypothetical protein